MIAKFYHSGLFCFLLLPAWNISIVAGAPVAILNHEVTFKMEATYWDWVGQKATVDQWWQHGDASPTLDCLFLGLFHVRDKYTSILSHCYFEFFSYTQPNLIWEVMAIIQVRGDGGFDQTGSKEGQILDIFFFFLSRAYRIRRWFRYRVRREKLRKISGFCTWVISLCHDLQISTRLGREHACIGVGVGSRGSGSDKMALPEAGRDTMKQEGR